MNHLDELRKEIRNRAIIYVHIFRELEKEIGQERALEVMKRALYARGKEKGVQLASRIGPPNLRELAAAFIEGKTDMDAFGHETVEEGDAYVLLRLNRCPLADAWKEAGLSPEERKLMCDIAYQIDFGKFETAGYQLSFSCRIADHGASCDMRVTI